MATRSDLVFQALFILGNGAWLTHCVFAYRKHAEFELKAPEYAKAIYCVWGDAGAICWPIRVVPLFAMEPPISVRRNTLALRTMLVLCLLAPLSIFFLVLTRR